MDSGIPVLPGTGQPGLQSFYQRACQLRRTLSGDSVAQAGLVGLVGFRQLEWVVLVLA